MCLLIGLRCQPPSLRTARRGAQHTNTPTEHHVLTITSDAILKLMSTYFAYLQTLPDGGKYPSRLFPSTTTISAYLRTVAR